MNYKKKYEKSKGYTPICKIGECSLKKLEFGIIELEAGETVDYNTEDKETAFILLFGHCDVSYEGGKFENIAL
jgi:5-deoxy-D-glucuronate isomerase